MNNAATAMDHASARSATFRICRLLRASIHLSALLVTGESSHDQRSEQPPHTLGRRVRAIGVSCSQGVKSSTAWLHSRFALWEREARRCGCADRTLDSYLAQVAHWNTMRSSAKFTLHACLGIMAEQLTLCVSHQSRPTCYSHHSALLLKID